MRLRVALGLVMAAVLAGCGSIGVSIEVSPWPGPYVHFVNLTSNVAVLGSSLLDDRDEELYVTPCGGALSVPAPQFLTDDGRLLVSILMDRTGSLDHAFADWNGPPSELEGTYWVGPIWSRGDISPEDLPRWIIIRPAAVEVAAVAPEVSPTASCAPWSELDQVESERSLE